MRSSSSISKLIRQLPSSPFSNPRTFSGRRPVRVVNWTAASFTSSSLFTRSLDLPFARLATKITPLKVQLSSYLQAVQELVGVRLVDVVADLAPFVRLVELRQLACDPPLVVELVLGFLRELLGDPCNAAHGREWQGDEPRDQAHAAPASQAWSANVCGGSGPRRRNCSSPW